MNSNYIRFLSSALVLGALTLACDLPFLAQQKQATFVQGTLQPGTPSSDLTPAPGTASDANATPPSGATADANVTPGAPSSQPTRRAPTATPRIAPGIYAASIRVDPANPRSGPSPVVFYVRFQNTYNEKKPYRWLVKIYRPGETKSFGETASISSDIPVGASEIASASNWHTNPFQCETFIARVYWLESGNPEPFEFKRPDGVNTPFVEFKVCP